MHLTKLANSLLNTLAAKEAVTAANGRRVQSVMEDLQIHPL
jgi:hypothetical protein